ncbi:hypothetical protein MAR_006604 [Mya arenaria]|uniref:Uncharacterized protein n=1 Tax=Mya arenaria TaxID=6604 RepID=A0ABY7DB53_MYAAR|nr:hypothetical protein MAR_006604 [Mya arenaria]
MSVRNRKAGEKVDNAYTVRQNIVYKRRHQGRRPAQVNSKIDRVKDHIYKDRRATVRSIGDDLVISISTIYRILTDEQGMSKVSARWVPP